MPFWSRVPPVPSLILSVIVVPQALPVEALAHQVVVTEPPRVLEIRTLGEGLFGMTLGRRLQTGTGSLPSARAPAGSGTNSAGTAGPERGVASTPEGGTIGAGNAIVTIARTPLAFTLRRPGAEGDEISVNAMGARKHAGQSKIFMVIEGAGELLGLGAQTTSAAPGPEHTADESGRRRETAVVVSPRGWAMAALDGGGFARVANGFEATTDGEALTVVIAVAATAKAAIERLTLVTGRPALVPKWQLGLWIEGVSGSAMAVAVAENLRRARLPFDGVLVAGLPAGDWGPEPGARRTTGLGTGAVPSDARPARRQLVRDMDARGVSLGIPLAATLTDSTPAFAEAAREGFLVRKRGGGLARPEGAPRAAFLDFTNIGAILWWKRRVVPAMTDGVSLFSLTPERVPNHAVAADGRTGTTLAAVYPALAAQAVLDAAVSTTGQGAVVRGSGDGRTLAARAPGTRGQVARATWASLAETVRAGLASGLAGEALWAPSLPGGGDGDIQAGVERVAMPLPRDLFLRWAAFVMLSPAAILPASWLEGDVDPILSAHARLRYSLVPYLMAAMAESAATGLPVMRPLALEHPGDPMALAIDDQYLLGADVMVAPVLSEAASARTVHFPAGTWYALDNPEERYEGPRRVEVPAPLDRILVFVRAGAIVPRLVGDIQHLKGGPSGPIRFDVYAGRPGHRQRLRYHDDGVDVALEVAQFDQESQVRLSAVPLPIEIRLVRPSGHRLVTETPVLAEDGVVRFDGQHGAELRFLGER
jgi:alpha-glucosidase (family GH31 glycosyl hydrolase)